MTALDTIVCGDALDTMRDIPDSTFGLILTSPPYNLLNSSGNGMKDGRGSRWAAATLRDGGYVAHDDAMPHDEYVQWQRDCLTEMWRLLTPDGAIFYNHKWRVQNGVLQDRADIVDGFPVRQVIIWQRAGGLNFNAGYFLPTYEVIYLIAKPDFRLAAKANAHGDVWKINQDRGNPHPAPFPLELAERVVASTTSPVVLDPFSGSGTTAVAALRLGRRYLGVEKNPVYCEMARERLDKEHAMLDARLPLEYPTPAGESRPEETV